MQNRRQFIADGCRLLVTVACFDLLSGCGPDSGVIGDVVVDKGHLLLPLADRRYQGLQVVGRGVYLVIASQRKPLIVTRVGENEVAAFSSECPHAGYQVLLPENGVLVCSSGHGGRFDLHGKAVGGPPPRSLQNFAATLRGNEVRVAYADAGVG